MATTNHLGISLVEQSQSQKEVTVNAALIRIDAMLNSGAKSRNINTPPVSPASGDLYIVGSSPTGDWAGQSGKITYFDQIWRFITPLQGATLWVNDEFIIVSYNSGSWNVVLSAYQTYNDISAATYTISSGDAAKVLRFTSASAVTVTLPNNLTVGFNCIVQQAAAGQITFTPASGAFRRNRQSHTKSAGQWAVCNLQVHTNSGGAAAEYVLSGDTAV